MSSLKNDKITKNQLIFRSQKKKKYEKEVWKEQGILSSIQATYAFAIQIVQRQAKREREREECVRVCLFVCVRDEERNVSVCFWERERERNSNLDVCEARSCGLSVEGGHPSLDISREPSSFGSSLLAHSSLSLSLFISLSLSHSLSLSSLSLMNSLFYNLSLTIYLSSSSLSTSLSRTISFSVSLSAYDFFRCCFRLS